MHFLLKAYQVFWTIVGFTAMVCAFLPDMNYFVRKLSGRKTAERPPHPHRFF